MRSTGTSTRRSSVATRRLLPTSCAPTSPAVGHVGVRSPSPGYPHLGRKPHGPPSPHHGPRIPMRVANTRGLVETARSRPHALQTSHLLTEPGHPNGPDLLKRSL